MVKTRIIRNLRLGKIAAVDRPCQEHALVAVIKRDETSGNGPEADRGKESQMSTIEKKVHDDVIAALKVEHETALGARATEIANLKNQIEAAVAKAAMSDDEKECMEEMDEDQKKKFLGMPKSDRKKLMGKRVEDESLDVGGSLIRKSVVGEDVFAALKFQQEEIKKSADRIKKAEDDAETARMEKRATDEFSALPGTASEKAAVLKSIGGQPEPIRKSFEAMMKSAQENASGAFKSLGHNNGSRIEISKGQKPFLDQVTKIQEVQKVSRLVALRKAQEQYPNEYEAFQAAGREMTPLH